MYVNKLNKEELISKLKHLQLLSMDADGTLTDGSIYLDNNGNQTRKFYAHDGVATRMLQEIGIYIVLITTSQERVFSLRSDIIGCNEYIPGCFNKGKELEALCKKLDIPLENTIHIGDDINDISAFLKVGLPIAVNNAVESVKKVCKYVTVQSGGNGAIREIADLIMIAKTGKPYGLPYVSPDIYKNLS